MQFAQLNVDARPGGVIKGNGQDQPGPFTFEGTFAPNSPLCRILKSYQSHKVYY